MTEPGTGRPGIPGLHPLMLTGHRRVSRPAAPLRTGQAAAPGPGRFAPRTDTSVAPPWPYYNPSPSWGGLIYMPPAAPVTSITTSFTVPSFPTNVSSATGSISLWVGIGSVTQSGISATYDTSQPGNNGSLGSWTWIYPDAGGVYCNIEWDHAHYPSAAGDNITLTFAIANNYYVATQANSTKGWSYSHSLASKHASLVTDCWGDGTAWCNPYNVCEIIIELESPVMPNYGAVTFSSIATVPAIDPAALVYVPTVSNTTGHTLQTPGTYSNGSFTMTWNGYT